MKRASPTNDNLVGQRFGKLIVILRSDNRGSRGARTVPLWECLCDCGNVTYKATDTLISRENTMCKACADRYATSKMNEKAGQMGLKNSYFENTTGLDDTTTNHHSCAYDIAILSRELIKYDLILKYSSMWQDSIRDGEMVLTNTNRLIRYYDGCNGLKTGSTDKAGFCITTTAKRGNMQLIAVILGADSKDERNSAARALLDFGFANFALFEDKESYLESIRVLKGKKDDAGAYSRGFSCIVEKGKLTAVEKVYEIPENIVAPINEGDTVGKITYILDGNELGHTDIYVCTSIEEINLFEVIARILAKIIIGK